MDPFWRLERALSFPSTAYPRTNRQPKWQQSWKVETAAGPMSMLLFTAIADQQYST
jgi:hypothetical protein